MTLMESPRWRGLARFSRQVHALFLKNLSFQVTKSLELPLADALFTMHKCHFKKRKQPNPPSYSCLLECTVAFMPTPRRRTEEEREDERRDRRVPGAALRAPRHHPARGGQRAGAASVPVRLRRHRVRHPVLHAHPGARLRRARAAEVAAAGAGAAHRGARTHAPAPAAVQGVGEELPRHRASHRTEPPACPRYSAGTR